MIGRLSFYATAVSAFLGLTVHGAPVEKRADIDPTVLQFALTLEHLENVFYKQAIKKFSLSDFEAAGYTADYYNNLHYIAFDEQEHVLLLESALKAAGQTPVQACTYKFPYTDVKSFITLSSVLEGVGTSAYLGGAPLITSKDYLTVAGSILAVEALHTSLQRLAVGKVPMANPLETSLDPTSVYTLAAAFIVSCPSSNVALPFTPFPSLAVDGATYNCEEPDCSSPSDLLKKRSVESNNEERSTDAADCSPPSASDMVTFTAAKKIPAGSYVTFVSGLTVTSVKGTISGMEIKAKVPAGIEGQSYVFVTKSNLNGTFVDSMVLFGPAILEVDPPAPKLDYSIM